MEPMSGQRWINRLELRAAKPSLINSGLKQAGKFHPIEGVAHSIVNSSAPNRVAEEIVMTGIPLTKVSLGITIPSLLFQVCFYGASTMMPDHGRRAKGNRFIPRQKF